MTEAETIARWVTPGARVLDVAAAQLIVREAGGVVGLADGAAFLDVPLGLSERRNFLAAVDAATLILLQQARAASS